MWTCPSGRRASGYVAPTGRSRCPGRPRTARDRLYREVDGAWRATYRVPGESRPRRVRGRTREEALRRRAEALTKALTEDTKAVDDGAQRVEHDRRVRGVVVEHRRRRARATVIAGQVRRSRRADHGMARRRANRESPRRAGGDVAVGAPQVPVRQDRGRHQSNIPIGRGRGGEPRADRDEPGRPGTATEDSGVGTASADGCGGSGRRRRRRGGSFRRRHRAAVCAGVASVGGAGPRLVGPRPRRRRRHRLPGECVRRRRRDDARATQDGRCQGPPSLDTRRGRATAPPPAGPGRRTSSVPERRGSRSSTRVGRSISCSPRRQADWSCARPSPRRSPPRRPRPALIQPGLGTHAGRSTAITVLYAEEGLDLADIARHVGHAAPATTAGYVRHLGRRPTATAEAASRLLDPTGFERDQTGADSRPMTS